MTEKTIIVVTYMVIRNTTKKIFTGEDNKYSVLINNKGKTYCML